MEAQNYNSQHSPIPSINSPSHEFSFTISFTPTNTTINSCNNIKNNSSTAAAVPAAAVDLSPADEIFFHGHLLPLHLLSHPPRASNDISIDNFMHNDRNLNYRYDDNLYHDLNLDFNGVTKSKEIRVKATKHNTLSSLIFNFAKLKKLVHESNKEEQDDKRPKRRKGFDMKRLVKKYVSLMDTIFTFRGSSERSKSDLRRRPYSFSGHSNRREWEGFREKEGQFSAPASMRTSPTNSGILSATSGTFSSSDDSTMEELQSAIQAAILHCKNSATVGAVKEVDKCKC